MITPNAPVARTARRALAATLLALLLALTGPAHAQDNLPPESELLAILQAPDASRHDKGVACRQLAVVGSPASVPVLIRLLDDPQLAHLARYGLEPMPYPEVNAALLESLDRLQGRHLVGVLNTLGVRRAEDAVPALSKLLASPDPEVADAAAAALGQIANVEAARGLQDALLLANNAQRNYLADAGLTCAQRLLREDRLSAARNLFDTIRQSDTSSAIHLAATRGAILARANRGRRLLLDQLRSLDPPQFQLGLRVVRELDGANVTRALARLLPNLLPDRQALLAIALGDRGDPLALPALETAAESGPVEVRVAALAALAQMPTDAMVALFLETGLSPDPEVADAAQEALLLLPGANYDLLLAAQLVAAEQPARLFIIDTLAQRRATIAEQSLLELAEHNDPATRRAALRALGNVATPAGWPQLVACLVRTASPEELAAVENALESACARFDNRPACAPALAAAFPTAPDAAQVILIHRLGQAGGDQALEFVRQQTVPGTSYAIRDAAIRTLTEWPEPAALPDLLAFIEEPDPDYPIYRTLAFRGYVRLVRDADLPTAERVQRLEQAMALARSTDEQRLVLGALTVAPAPATLQLAVDALATPGLEAEAAAAILQLAQSPVVQQDPAALTAALDRLLATTSDPAIRRQARKLRAELP